MAYLVRGGWTWMTLIKHKAVLSGAPKVHKTICSFTKCSPGRVLVSLVGLFSPSFSHQQSESTLRNTHYYLVCKIWSILELKKKMIFKKYPVSKAEDFSSSYPKCLEMSCCYCRITYGQDQQMNFHINELSTHTVVLLWFVCSIFLSYE